MAKITYANLPTVTLLDGTEIVPMNQAGTTKTATTGQIAGVGGLGIFAVASLPTPAQGLRAFASDTNSTTFAALAVGGGVNFVPVFATSSAWFIG